MDKRWKMFWIALALAAALLIGILIFKHIRREEILEIMEKTDKFFANILPFHHLRIDNVGHGGYDPVAHGGTRPTKKHNGVDLITTPGTVVTSPINGRIVKKKYPYASDLTYEGVFIRGNQEHAGIEFTLFYMIPDEDLIGKEVTKGQRIGVAQKISNKYPKALDHIHVELYVEGKVQDPSKALFA